ISTQPRRNSFAPKILGGHRPPLQLGVRGCRGALLSARDAFLVQSPPKQDATKTLLMARLPASMIQAGLRVQRFIVSAPGRNEVRERWSIFTAIGRRIN